MKDVVIASAVRTPIGSYNGSLASLSAVDLGKIAIKAALERAGVKPEMVGEVLFGCILQAGLGQGVGRQAAIRAGIPDFVPATTINKLCGSGMKAVTMGVQAIREGDADIVVAGGTESMSNAPYLVEKARWGYRMGDGVLVDSMIRDGLSDIFNNYHMGVTAENVAERYRLSREEQDRFAFESQQKAARAIAEGVFVDEIVPVTIKGKKGDTIVTIDEHPKKGVTLESLASLKPAFKKDGTVTAGNASGINDGAAALVLMSADKANELGVPVLAKIRGYASSGVNPAYMGIGPVPATRKALEKADVKMKDIDLIEANEAFAAQSLAVGRDLNFDINKLNVNGGAIALGHPIGASGARILVTLLYAMQKRGLKTGLATLCIGGGMGIATIVER